MNGMVTSEVTRSKDGVPQWDGDAASFQDYEEQALQWEQGVPYHKRYLSGPKLVAELSGPARKHVMGKRPQWLSFDGGVSHLLKHLRECLGRPTIPEMTEYLNKYFRNSRRKRFETMNHYITRKTEVYHRARQALARVQKFYAKEETTWSWASWQQEDWYQRDWYQQEWHHRDHQERPRSEVNESTEESVSEEREHDEEDRQSNANESSHTWRPSSSYRDYSHRHHHVSDDEPWKLQTEELLPEFLQGWYLLVDAGLDSTEKNMIQTALQEDYSVQRVARELRLQWPDDDLKKRDQQAKQAGFWNEELDAEDDGLENADEAWLIDELTEEGQVLYSTAEERAQEAYALIQQGRRTLKEARARQHQVKLSRQYYKTSVRRYTPNRGPHQHRQETAQGQMSCLRCGKAHRTHECPERNGTASDSRNLSQIAEEAPFVCFTDESAMSVQDSYERRSTQEAVSSGCAVIDGGATKTLGSVEAIQTVLDINASKHGDTRLRAVDVSNKPIFGFGNSSQDQCVSTAQLQVTANEKPGMLQIHALDRGSGPILLSIHTLRSLKAIIDFEADLLVLRGLDDTKVVPLERSAAGHQLLPLTEDLFKGAHTCKSRVPSLREYISI